MLVWLRVMQMAFTVRPYNMTQKYDVSLQLANKASNAAHPLCYRECVGLYSILAQPCMTVTLR